MSLLTKLKDRHHTKHDKTLTMEEYLTVLKSDKTAHLGPADRLLKAIGKPKLIDTSKGDRRLLRLFGNTTIRQYAPFSQIFGIEQTIEKIVDFLKHASQGLEESRQVLYLRGPVGSAKSTVVEILKKLMEKEPIYVLATENSDGSLITSPVNESPLGLFSKEDAKELKVPANSLKERISPWARKRLDEFGGDISKFVVLKTYPSASRQVAIAKVEPGDENNNDISTLVGKTNIRQLSRFDQMDPDSYSYSGGLCKANQGCLDYVELNKSPIQMLNPLLTATQEGNYNPTEGIGAIPFEGIIFGHSNDTEWQKFKSDKRNEAFLDRFFVVDVAYNLRADEEVQISKTFLSRSSLANAHVAPHTLDLLGQFVIMSRLDSGASLSLETKMRVYNGEPMKEKDPNAKSFEEYQKNKPHNEGFTGISTRDSFKIIANVFDQDVTETAADPVNLFKSLSNYIDTQSEDTKDLLNASKEILMANYKKLVTDDIQTAYLDTGDDFCQAEFERYYMYANAWISRLDYRDPETNELLTVEQLEEELIKIEEPLGTVNVNDFRYEAVHFIQSAQLSRGDMPRWNSYEKLAKVIREKMNANMESMLPVITFSAKKTSGQDARHNEFVKRMMDLGYTKRQVQRVVEWQRMYKNS